MYVLLAREFVFEYVKINYLAKTDILYNFRFRCFQCPFFFLALSQAAVFLEVLLQWYRPARVVDGEVAGGVALDLGDLVSSNLIVIRDN